MELENTIKLLHTGCLLLVWTMTFIAVLHRRLLYRWFVAPLGVFTVLLASFYLCVYGLNRQRLPFLNLSETLLFLGWTLHFIYVAMDLFSKQISMGVIVIPLIFFLFLQHYMQLPQLQIEAVSSIELIVMLHISFSLLGYGVFVYSFFLTLLYQRVFKALKNKTLSFFVERMPSLGFFEKKIKFCLFVGMVFLAMGIGWGYSWSFTTNNFSTSIMIKLVSASLTWGLIVLFWVLKVKNKTTNLMELRLYVFGFLGIVVTFLTLKR